MEHLKYIPGPLLKPFGSGHKEAATAHQSKRSGVGRLQTKAISLSIHPFKTRSSFEKNRLQIAHRKGLCI